MAKPRDDRQKDLLRPALEDIIDLGHSLVRLAREIDWQFLDGRFASVCAPGAGQPPLPTRLVAGLLILKHMHDLSDEVLCLRWLENPYYQFFCGEVSFCHKLPFDRSNDKRPLRACAREAPMTDPVAVLRAPGGWHCGMISCGRPAEADALDGGCGSSLMLAQRSRPSIIRTLNGHNKTYAVKSMNLRG
jgi:hypothetical protein